MLQVDYHSVEREISQLAWVYEDFRHILLANLLFILQLKSEQRDRSMWNLYKPDV
jgi:hypothetical protein